MAQYRLDHLVQPDHQAVVGPIQDDEALFLYALIRVTRVKRVLEAGGLDGYSATNFLRAVGEAGVVYTVDVSPVRSLSGNHVVLQKDIATVTAADIHAQPLDLVFFDCHVFDAQIAMFENLRGCGLITERTIIALHDTNTHPAKYGDWCYPIADRQWIHQAVERRMVNEFHRRGYDALVLHTDADDHNPQFPFRHGLTVMQMFKPLAT